MAKEMFATSLFSIAEFKIQMQHYVKIQTSSFVKKIIV